MEVKKRDDEVNEATLATLPDVHRTVSPTRLQRLGNITVNQLGAVGVDIEIEARPDGRVAVIMAPEWSSLLLANLEAQAVAFKEKLQRSAFELQRRHAEQRAASGEAERRWEDVEWRVKRRYKILLAHGLSHRDAIRQIKKESRGTLPATIIQVIAEGAGPEKRRQRRERHERIRQKAQYLTRKEIAQQEGLSVHGVRYVLDKGRPKTRTYFRAELAERRTQCDLIRALYARGKKPREIIKIVEAKPQRVYNCLNYVRRKRREHDAKTDGS